MEKVIKKLKLFGATVGLATSIVCTSPVVVHAEEEILWENDKDDHHEEDINNYQPDNSIATPTPETPTPKTPTPDTPTPETPSKPEEPKPIPKTGQTAKNVVFALASGLAFSTIALIIIRGLGFCNDEKALDIIYKEEEKEEEQEEKENKLLKK